MPGFTIHIAIGKEYIRKHKGKVQDELKFIKGIIAPDLNEEKNEIAKNKSITHYGNWGKYKVTTNIDEFLKDEKVNIKDDYWKGYLIHLLTDHYFYNKYFKQEYMDMKNNKGKFYYDYDCLNFNLIKKYDIQILDNIKKYMIINQNDDKPKYLKEDKIINFIDRISNINLEDEIKTIEKNGMEGLV